MSNEIDPESRKQLVESFGKDYVDHYFAEAIGEPTLQEAIERTIYLGKSLQALMNIVGKMQEEIDALKKSKFYYAVED